MADASPSAATQASPLLLERMLFFSDAVFAIVLTLMAVDLRLPPGVDDAHLMSGLALISDRLTAFVMSFAVVGVFWIVHVITLRALSRFDFAVAAFNLVFLFTIVLAPFATSLVGRFGPEGQAWRFYCLVFVAISLAQAAVIVASHRDEPRLVREEHHGRLWFRLARASAPGLAFAVGLILSLAGLHHAARFTPLLVPLFLFAARSAFPGGRAPPQAAAADAPPEAA
jgi:uncharacterized membrane protein